MTVKVFTKNKDNKIEFTEKELKDLLDEVYREGVSDGSRSPYYTYTTPRWYKWIYCTDTSDTSGRTSVHTGSWKTVKE